MQIISICLLLTLLALPSIRSGGQASVHRPDKILPYRKTEKGELTVHVFLPKGWNASDQRPGLLLFFGGGFRGGAPSAMYSKAAYFASRGMVAASADYRVKNTYAVSAEACFADARSAMRFVRSHAAELGIDPGKLLAGGGSSGGVMAASLAYGKGPDNPEDNQNVSVKPAGLVLFNPAIVQFNNTDLITGSAEEKLKIDRMISPMSNLDGTGPPMIVFYGTDDWLLRRGREFCEKALSFGTRCELYTAEGQPHGFFNAPPWHAAVTWQTDKFLAGLGYLTGEPTIQVSPKATLVKVLPQPSAQG